MYDSSNLVCNLCEKEFSADQYEEKFCWDCKKKHEFFQKMIHDYIKENLKLTLKRECGSNFIYLYASIEDEEIYQDCVDIEDF